MLIAQLADIHLGHRQYGLDERLEDYNRAFLSAVDELVRLREERGLDTVVISGDFFDTQRPSPSIYITAIRGLARLREAGIRVIAIRGNHDSSVINPVENPLAVLHQMGLIQYLDNNYVDLGEVRVIGVGTVYTDMQNRLINSLNALRGGGINIAVIHQYIEGAPYIYPMPNVDVFMINEKPLAQLDIDYFAVGHIHEHELRHPRINAVYPGSLEIWDAREFEVYEYSNGKLRKVKDLDPKGFLLLDVGGNGVKVSGVRLGVSRRLIRVRVKYDEAKPSVVRSDVAYIASNMDQRGSLIILEVEGRVAGGYSTRDFNANALRKLFSRAWVDVRLSLERQVGGGERSVRVFGGINEIIRQALRSRLGNDELVGVVMDIIERVRADDEDGALKVLENLVGVPLRGSKSITDWLGVQK
ncbi:DNA repair exonuclease [Vulcanisaeta distributa]|uniref:Metallophosphoesterase n=1 Tax=Vulcanisaeta distributa (strain DSM 14429 / JCM 11212 / NBRC 100878 / IC-017) TaxID=572478 RepID=E1QVA0_VULDI|nr:DNA repair exonuclease [Vulcanisaeta distributa]ADN50027.1 metallophosphoesterase [Vulcanisaeta distributa DSM 14429]